MAKKILAFCVVVMAFAVMPAMAAATNSPELVENGTKVEVGKLIQATNTEATTMKNAAGETLVSCSRAILTGNVTKNDGSNVEGDINAASFDNGTTGGDCTGILGSTSVNANPATNGLPWCIRSTSTMLTDEFQVRGGACTAAQRAIRFVLNITALGINCVYQRSAAINGTFTTSKTESILTIANVDFPLLEGGFGCPESGFLNMKFKIETDGTNTALGLI